MNLPILVTKKNDINGFVKFWSKHYDYPLESLYNERINKEEFSHEDLQQLFIWKNGMKLSARKQESFKEKILSKRSFINKLKKEGDFDLEIFHLEFNNLSAVWKIFLLHLIHPDKFPIYDQHINRAYNFIHNLDYKNISAESMTNKEKEEFYFETYIQFIRSLTEINIKSLDEAFFTFGQFINTKKYVQFIE